MAAFGDARLTARCLSILMTEGHREVFHRTCEPTLISACPATYDVGPWSMFVPQKQRVKKLLKSPASIVAGIRACIHVAHRMEGLPEQLRETVHQSL